jgi:hypothetical protein
MPAGFDRGIEVIGEESRRFGRGILDVCFDPCFYILITYQRERALSRERGKKREKAAKIDRELLIFSRTILFISYILPFRVSWGILHPSPTQPTGGRAAKARSISNTIRCPDP